MLPRLKKTIERIPYPIGRIIASVPYGYRPILGRPYRCHSRRILSFDHLGLNDKKRHIDAAVLATIRAAYRIPFYRDLYESKGISLRGIKGIDDLHKLPIITKADLQDWPVESRSGPASMRYKTNTGGSTGNPLSFYITPRLIPKEWAHMHTIWAKYGYTQKDLKLVFGGRDLQGGAFKYDALRHSFLVNSYAPVEEIVPSLLGLLRKHEFRFLHGYPSAIANFINSLSDECPELLDSLKASVKGVFLGSEYPTPIYRNVLDNAFRNRTVSWYGHTERCVLAWERNQPYIYYPFQTYGFAEAVPTGSNNSWRLVTTSYLNDASPFVRYDTGDLIEPVEMDGDILVAFKIKEGRVGDYIVDRSGSQISLTALIFGRHHSAFELTRHIQVCQERPGHVHVVIVPIDGCIDRSKVVSMFDFQNVDLDIDFVFLGEPVRTTLGKVPLKISFESLKAEVGHEETVRARV